MTLARKTASILFSHQNKLAVCIFAAVFVNVLY